MLISVHIYKIFIQLSVTLIKLCHIKCDHVVNFAFHLKNTKNPRNVIVLYLTQNVFHKKQTHAYHQSELTLYGTV